MRILIVDDEAINRELLRFMLEQSDFNDCHEAGSGREALALADDLKPDIVLLDVMMPDMDGYSVAPKIKAMSGDVYLPIIFITALDDADAIAKCFESGGDDVTTKPFNQVILLAKIRAHARTRELSIRFKEQNESLLYYQASIEQEHAIVEHIFANALRHDNELDQYFETFIGPASNFNGDLLLMAKSPAGGLYVLIGDFTGHGLASAIGALPVSRAFHAMTRKGLAITEIASTLNNILLGLLPDNMFFAAAMISIAEDGRQITVWNGGLPSLLLVDQNGRVKKRFEALHMALGILEDNEFETDVERVDGDYGDKLFGYSDGVIEIENDQGKMLGDEGLEQWLSQDPDWDLNGLYEKLVEYRVDEEQTDDITMIAFQCQPLDIGIKVSSDQFLPLKISLHLDANQIKASHPVEKVLELLSSRIELRAIRSQLFTVLSELYNNALDHGVLGLGSDLKDSPEGFMSYFTEREMLMEKLTEGYVNIDMEIKTDPRALFVTFQDSGPGFPPSCMEKSFESDSNAGRGLGLVRETCDTLEYDQAENKLTVSFAL